MNRESIIAVDWGSTNLRASRLVAGEVAGHAEAALGVKQTGGKSYEAILADLYAEWLTAPTGEQPTFLLSGMIGSREGWVEVPYVDTPAGPDEIAAGLHRFESAGLGEIAIVPGLRHLEPDGTADVMRGEETQVIGALAECGPDALICIPGTHSKWIRCRAGRIERFRTWVTGEAFELLSRSPLLAKGDAADPEGSAFLRGLDHSARDGGLLRQIFLGRTDMLMGRVPAAGLPSLLSGILIGAEIREAAAWTGPNATEPVTLFGAGERVLWFYERAFEFFDRPWRALASDPHVAGALSIARLGTG